MPDEAEGAARSLQLRFPASSLEVRAALQELLRRLPQSGFDAELPGVLEIVMAEVMNNVVEHAYRGAPGMIEVQVTSTPGRLHCRVTDFGLPMEEGRLPKGRLPGPGPDGLPEGGFGWFLITSLAQEITYRRDGDANRLSFVLMSDPGATLSGNRPRMN